MDPATVIGGVGSVLGAVLGRNRAARPSDTTRHTIAGIYGQAQAAREAGEMYGFNPLTLLGVSSPLQAQAVDNSQFGAQIANAALAVADGVTQASQQKAYLEKLEAQNQELRTALDTATLRPKVPGIYSRPVPTISAAGPGQVQSVTMGYDVLSSADSGRRGEVLETGAGGLPVVVRGDNDDRPEEIAPVLNEPAYKRVDFFGKDLVVWNDEAAESEVASAASIATLPFQYLYAVSRDSAKRVRDERAAGIQFEPAFTLGGDQGDRGDPGKRVDLRAWPWDGWNPFGPGYRRD